MAGSLPSLPTRKQVKGQQARHRPENRPDVETLKDIAATVKNSSLYERLSTQPEALQQALDSNTQLQAVLAGNAELSHLLTANGIAGLIDAVQSNDPSAALRQVMGDSTMDLSEQRKLLIQLQSFTAQLKLNLPQQQAARASSSSSGTQQPQQQQGQQEQQQQQPQQPSQQQQLLMARLQQRMAKMQGMQSMLDQGSGQQQPTPAPPLSSAPTTSTLPVSTHAARQGSPEPGAASFSGWARPEPNSSGNSFSNWLPDGTSRSNGASLLSSSSSPTPGHHQHQHQHQHQHSDITLPLLPDARTHYESVEPSKWRPSSDEQYLELYRRAYCTSADALFPPVWFSIMASLAGVLSFWALLAAAIIIFMSGVYVMAVRWAGVPSKQLGVSKVMPSFLISLEVLSLVVYLSFISPAGFWWSSRTLLMLACFASMYAAHLVASTSDPGYVTPQDEDCSSKGQHEQGSKDQAGGLGQLNSCLTCNVPRQLRSKHCPLCKRCVLKFDHHCPFLWNCIGQGNQRAYITFLFTAIITEATFVMHSFSAMVATYAAVHPTAAASMGSIMLFLRSVHSAGGSHPGLLLFTLLHMPLWCALVFLLLRSLLCIAANLTTNELMNRDRYLHLRHETAGFCNRFDTGVASNCWQFWMDPVHDWWSVFEANDRAMNNGRRTLVTKDSLSVVIRVFDKQWALHKQGLVEARKKRQQRHEQQRIELALQNIGVDKGKAASLANKQQGCGAGCEQGGCKQCDSHV